MRIIYIYKALAAWGGIERILINKMNYLSDNYGYDIYMLTTDQGTHPIPYRMSSKITYKDLNIRFHTKYSLPIYKRPFEQKRLQKLFEQRLKDSINTINPDIIISTADLYVYTINKLRGKIPYIVESHSMKSHTATIPNPKIKWLYNYRRNKYLNSIKEATAFVTLTNGEAQEWNDIRTDAIVIPNIINLNTENNVSSLNSKKIIFVGRFAYQKGINYLFNIWEKVNAKYPEWQLDIYGEGEDKNYFLKKINSSKKNYNIKVYSPTSKIPEKYMESSILILTSIYEPFGLVIPEAMSFGLPVVSFNCPYGPADIIDDGKDGFLIKPYDCDEFAEKIINLIQNDELRKHMGANAFNKAKKYYPDNIMLQWKQLFENLTN